MAVIYKAAVQLAANSALPRDVSENVLFWNFATTPGTGALDSIAAEIALFFNGTTGGVSASVGSYLARDRDYSTHACKVAWYAMPATPGPTGPPVHVSSWTLTDPGGTFRALPDQVAVCLSFHSNLTGVTTHLARRKGRIFIGPLNENTLEEIAGAVAPQTVSSVFMTDLGLSAKLHLRDNTASFGDWSVFSRVDWAPHTVTAGYVDDRFDTQRRRLERPDSRIVWS
jgi:hypothetical protein